MLRTFKEYVENDKPFSWAVVKEHDNPDFVNKSKLTLNYIRFKLTMEAVMKYFKEGANVLDVGVYPGTLPKIFKEFYPGDGKYKFFGCGLGFDDKFVTAMENLDVTLFETDLDPRLHLQKGRADKIPLSNESIDLAFCTDVIEHFFDPFGMLKEVNRVMKLDEILILTTDNVSQYGYILSLLRGKSNYPDLLASNIFFNGDWRPHFREYSRDELIQLLKYAGFEVIEHRYFESEFSSYQVVNNKLTKTIKKIGFVARIKAFIKMFLTSEWLFLFGRKAPHLKDSHLVVARKTVAYETMLKNAPQITDTMDEWMKQRKRFKNQ